MIIPTPTITPITMPAIAPPERALSLLDPLGAVIVKDELDTVFADEDDIAVAPYCAEVVGKYVLMAVAVSMLVSRSYCDTADAPLSAGTDVCTTTLKFVCTATALALAAAVAPPASRSCRRAAIVALTNVTWFVATPIASAQAATIACWSAEDSELLFTLLNPTVDSKDRIAETCCEGANVGNADGAEVLGTRVGARDGAREGRMVGALVVTAVDTAEGVAVGTAVGTAVG